MKVELLRYTQDAETLLLLTKGTRLSHDDDPSTWTPERRSEHLEYMRNTIRSSWEFVVYVFSISGVSRAFTHQLVRTRAGCYAQQSQRASDVRAAGVVKPNLPSELEWIWEAGADAAFHAYESMIDSGVPLQDARGILPTNTKTSIVAQFNLRTMSEMARVRLCTRTQGEYQDIFRAMRAAVIEVHPWAADFIHVSCVADGVCAFPNYGPTGCPVWFPELDRSEAKRIAAERFAAVRHEANPVAKGGKA